MQNTSPQFDAHAVADVRPLSYKVRWSPTKAFDDDVTFFTLDVSLLDGPDILAPSTGNVVQQWDKYEYEDITARIISVETDSKQLEPYSVVQQMADITVNNYDDYFTPNSASPIEQYIRPRRPFRILMGFGNEVVPVFVGLSSGMPEIDRKSKTARFHCVDFLTYLFDQVVDRTIVLENYSTGEILEHLLLYLGLSPNQFSLDSTSFNRIPYFYVEKDQKFGSVVRDLMQAEQGRLWMDETGVIRFLNRQNYPTVPVTTYTPANTIDWSNSNEADVINVARIKSEILAEQPLQPIWEMAETVYVNGSRDIWVSLEEPVTLANNPTQETTEIDDSYFIADGSLSASITVFAKTILLEFTGTGNLTELKLFGTPVRVIDVIDVEYSDATSILDYEELLYEFKTNYIQDREKAQSIARLIVEDYKDFGSIVEMHVKGNPALQIGDVVTLSLEGYTGDYIVSNILNKYWKPFIDGSAFDQFIQVKKRTIINYFILDSSLLDGGDVLL